jgi:integrating conjugative element protein (TIGR03765 family)
MKIIFSLMLMLLSFNCFAVVVLYDDGQGVSIAPYKKQIMLERQEFNRIKQKAQRGQPRLSQQKTNVKHSKTNMKPGKVAARKIKKPALINPLFIVGADKYSLKWLKANRKQLKKIGAVGLVVNIKSQNQLKQLQSVGGDVQMIAMSANMIAQQLKLKRYPVLITKTGIEQ